MVWRKNQLDLWDGQFFGSLWNWVCGYIYYLAVTKSYEVVEGTVTEIHAELLFDGFKRVLVQGDDGITTELLLNKETVVMYGKAYRFILTRMHMHSQEFEGWMQLLILEIFLAWRR